MTEQETAPNETPKTDKYNSLLQEIDKYLSLDAWWHERVFTPTLRNFIPQFLALVILEGVILYTHNWLAAFLCAVILVSKMYNTVTMMSVNMVSAYLICQVREAFNKGYDAGQENEETETTTNE